MLRIFISSFYTNVLPFLDWYENLCLTLGVVVDRISIFGDTLHSTLVFPRETTVEVFIDLDEEVDISSTVDCFSNSFFVSSIVRVRFVGFGDKVVCLRRKNRLRDQTTRMATQ